MAEKPVTYSDETGVQPCGGSNFAPCRNEGVNLIVVEPNGGSLGWLCEQCTERLERVFTANMKRAKELTKERTVRGVGTDLHQPCVECPFRKNSAPGWLGPWKPESILDDAVNSDGSFVCHRTHTAEVHQFCAGAAIFMNKSLKLSRDADYANFQRVLKGSDVGVAENVFDSRQAFIDHHRSPAAVYGNADGGEDALEINPDDLGDA